jgi:large subunit ribosomal protein L9
MELILKQDVENLGFKDDVVKVKNGYGRNYLIPQGMAILATPSAKKVLAENLKQRAFKEKKIVDDAQALAKKITALEVKIAAKAGSGDKLFGSVGTADLSAALSEAGHDVDKKFIKLAGSTVKRLGKYTASIRLHREVNASLDFEVVKAAEE